MYIINPDTVKWIYMNIKKHYFKKNILKLIEKFYFQKSNEVRCNTKHRSDICRGHIVPIQSNVLDNVNSIHVYFEGLMAKTARINLKN